MSEPTASPPIAVKPRDWSILLRCYAYLRPYWWTVVRIYVALVVITGLNLLVPQLIRWTIDRGIQNQNASLLTWSVAGLLGLTLTRGVILFFQGRWLEVASQSVAYDLRNDIQHKLTSLSFSYHDRAETGQLLSRAVQDVERIRFLTGRATWRIVDGVVSAVAITGALLTMNATLALFVMVVIPVLLRQGLIFGSRYRPLSLVLQQELGTLTGQLEQNLRGTRVVKAFAQEDAEIARFEGANNRYFTLAREGARLEAVHTPLFDLIVNAGAVAIMLYGGLQVINGTMSLGTLVAFTTYLTQLSAPVRTLGRVIPAVALAATAGERIFAILDTVPEVVDAPNAVPLYPLQGHIQFERVSFAYGPHHNALHDVSFEARAGQVVALLGATGSGKSTLVNLILRFYDATSGRILIDGHDVRTLQVASLRRQIGTVLQETTLFATTVRANIAFGREEATEAEIIATAKAAQAHDFIVNLPDGYDTEVGERGVTLSGGQKQRLAIARALLINPRVLILDDATASVDTETERRIQEELDNLMVGRTTFVIAHRLSTVRRADLILVLDKGRIVDRGTHADLIKRSGLYREIYTRQLRSDEEDPAPPVEAPNRRQPWSRLAEGD